MNKPAKTREMGFIHNFIPGTNHEVLLLLHGTGGNEDDLLSISQMIDSEATVLAPRGKVLENGMPRYFRRLSEGVFDLEDLRFRTHELADFVKQASERYSFGCNSVTAIGYSNGASIAASLLLLRPEAMKNAILFRAVLPLDLESIPVLSGKSVFLSGGKYDPIIPRDKLLELRTVLERAGAEVSINWEEATHSLVQDEIDMAREWLRKH